MLRRTALIVLAGSLLLGGCVLPKVDEDADRKARALYDQIRTGADLARNQDLGAELKTPEAMAELAKVKAALPEGAPTSADVRSWHLSTGNEGTTATVVHAYAYPARTVLAETVLAKDKAKVWKVVGFHVGFAGPSAAPQPPRPAVTVEGAKDI
ncbi:hypothetical protein [Caulobacter mirabilis]|uniref:DUF4019 domain-containing protein n=1 Tax=Caulobacter mirabilis TaxID=69666 RepID=A0A2D2B1W8_9CAUL|nr:hypothetical protein [Caulobacter mirabilis]ATQ44250.1 hypothetical protein CSW64_18580 [Caulobacter mirabilis]